MSNQSKKIILEKRFDLFDKIKKYVRPEGQAEYFMHFTNVEGKLGLNPQSNFNTPIGVYGYVLTTEIYNDFVNGRIKFASDRPYISVGKIKSDSGRKIGIFGNGQPGNYSEKDLSEDVLKLYPIFLKLYEKNLQEFIKTGNKSIAAFKDTTRLIVNISKIQQALDVNDENVILHTLKELSDGLWRSYSLDLKRIIDMLYRLSSDYLYNTGYNHPKITSKFINYLYEFHKILKLVPQKLVQIKVDYVTSRNKEELKNIDVDSLDSLLLPQTLPIAKSALVSLHDNLISISKILLPESQTNQRSIEIYDNFKKDAFEKAKSQDAQTKFWNLTRLLATKYSSINGTKSLIAWTKILMDIGYGGFIDYGSSIIHENEPTQCVLFPGNYELVEQLKNVNKNEAEINKLKSLSYIFRNIDNKSDFNAIKNILTNIPHGLFDEFIEILRSSLSSFKSLPDDYIKMLISIINENSNNNSIIFSLNIILYALKNNSLSENQNKKIYEQLKDLSFKNYYTIDKLIKSILIQISQKIDSLNSNIFDDLIKYDKGGECELIEISSDFKYITSKKIIRKVIFDDGYDFANSTKAILLSNVEFTDKDFLIEILDFLKSRKIIEQLIGRNRYLIVGDEDLLLSVIKLIDKKGLFPLVDNYNLIKYPLSNEFLKFFEDSMIESYKNKSSVESLYHIGKLLSLIAGESEIRGFKFSDDLMNILLENSLNSNIMNSIVKLSDPDTNSVFDNDFLKDFSIKIFNSQEVPAKSIFLSKSLNSLINYSFNNKLDQEYLDVFMGTLYEMNINANTTRYIWNGILHSEQLLREIIDNDGKYQIPQKKWDQLMIYIISELNSGSLGIKMTLSDLEKIKRKTNSDKVKNYIETFKAFLKESRLSESLLEIFIKNIVR